jgi:hypothetical protein
MGSPSRLEARLLRTAGEVDPGAIDSQEDMQCGGPMRVMELTGGWLAIEHDAIRRARAVCPGGWQMVAIPGLP